MLFAGTHSGPPVEVSCCVHGGGGAQNGFTMRCGSSAAANIVRQPASTSAAVGFGFCPEERHGRHDLAGLAIAALRNLFGNPGLLNGVAAVRREAFDSGDLLAGRGGNRQSTGALSGAVDVNGTGAALGDTAAVFGAGHVERVAKDPQKRGRGIDIDRFVWPLSSNVIAIFGAFRKRTGYPRAYRKMPFEFGRSDECFSVRVRCSTPDHEFDCELSEAHIAIALLRRRSDRRLSEDRFSTLAENPRYAKQVE